MMIKFMIVLFMMVTAGSESAAIQPMQSGEQEVRSILEERDREIKRLVGPRGTEHTEEQRSEIREIVNGMIDFRSMASYTLGDHFTQISSETREEFVDLFSRIVRDQSLNRLDIYRAEVSYNSIEVNGSEAHVETIVALDNVRTPVAYTLVRNDGEWKITDMIIDEVSTAESYNRQFQSIIRQRGFDALMESLRRRAART